MKLSIIIPAYNEEKRIASRLDDLLKVFEEVRKSGKLDYEIVIVINNTKDKTESIVRKYQKKNKRVTHLNLKQGGKGYATIEGFKDALKRDNDYIGFVDCDMATTAKELARLALRLKESGADGIIASRYLPGARVFPKQSLKRIIASRCYNLYIRILFLLPYRDTQCGAKIFSKRAIAKIAPHIINTKWAFDVDILFNLKKYGFKVLEEPTTWSDRTYSKVNLMNDGFRMGLSMLRLRVLNSPFPEIMNFYDKLPKWMKLKLK
jgi:glycosyltransferase involved in cell wall biosynthesis